MRFRTAYLPRVGERLVCRLDARGAEISLEGEVLWRRDQGRGGEFGLRFADLDDQTIDALRSLYGTLAPSSGSGDGAERGSRVRLHIEGLSAPMKARVCDATSGELMVGSNLDFLRVGRGLAVEDVEHGGKRDAYIDHVKVEIDPASNVPQLVVSLRYEGATTTKSGSLGRMATLPFGFRSPNIEATDAGTTGQGDAPLAGDDAGPEDEPMTDEADLAHGPTEPAESAADGAAGRLSAASTRARRMSASLVGAAGPFFSGLARRTTGAANGLVGTIQRVRAERAEAKRAKVPRRMTAPPPAGALKSEGRKLVREDGTELDEGGRPRTTKKAAALGGAIGLAAVLGAFGVVRLIGTRQVAAAPDMTHAAQTIRASAEAAPPAAPGTPTANVPLFGATPLSTTEPAPGAPAAPALAPGKLTEVSGDADGDDEPGIDDKASDGKEFGSGNVTNPIVLKLKLDGPIEKLSGASGALGFTVRVPDRHSISSSADFAKKDRRIAAVHVANRPTGAEITVKFKDAAPAFLAKAKGDRLEILLGREGSKKLAKAHEKGAKAKSKKSAKK